MPYIIETRYDHEPAARRLEAAGYVGEAFQLRHSVPTRTAVVTLDEARDYTFNARVNDDGQIEPLPESGGTVGPLPDGTVIEVREMSYEDIAGIPDGEELLADGDSGEIVAAFNAA